MKKRSNYNEESIKLGKAIDIAIESYKKFPPEMWDEKTLNHVINCYVEWKDDALYPQPEFKKITSLKYIIESVFTSFQESSGKCVDYFWQQIKNQNLDYVRQDKLIKIIARGKIKGRIEFEYVTDLIVVAEQEKRINSNEAKELGIMLNEFETSKKNKTACSTETL